jgi:sulfite exporter TauE/SafE
MSKPSLIVLVLAFIATLLLLGVGSLRVTKVTRDFVRMIANGLLIVALIIIVTQLVANSFPT